MPRTYHQVIARLAGGMTASILLWAGVVTPAAQFHIPKVPGVSKTNKTSETKPSPGSTLEVVSSVSPDSAPPGGRGQIVLTGQNFSNGMTLKFTCKGAQFSPDSIKVESPTRLTAQISVPVSAQEGPCGAGAASTAGKEPFRISYSASMPVELALMYMGEGDMQYQDIMMSMSKSMMAASQSGGKVDTGTLQLDGGSIKYVKGGATTFSESTSAVKKVEPVQMYGQTLPYFRIVFNSGKIYTFGPNPSGSSDSNSTAVCAFLQKKLGK